MGAAAALALMDYEQVDSYSNLYSQQHLVMDTAVTYIRDDTRIGAPMAGGRTLAQLNPQEIDAMVRACTDTLSDIDLLEAYMRPLVTDYKPANQ